MSKKQSRAIKALRAGIKHFQQDQPREAEVRLREALRLAPELGDAHNNLGVLLASTNRMAEARVAFKHAFELAPKDLEAARNLAVTALRTGATEQALEALFAAVALAPNEVALRTTLAQTLADAGRFRDAHQHVAEWASRAPRDPAAHAALGSIRVILGDHANALSALRTARALDANQPGLLRDLAACLERARFTGYDEVTEAELLACFDATGIEPQDVARATGQLLRAKYHLDDEDVDARGLEDWGASGWPDDPLLRSLLRRAINVDAQVERVLVSQRHQLLVRYSAEGCIAPEWLGFAADLALQCFLNEFIWAIPAEMQHHVDAIGQAEDSSESGGLNLDVLLMTALFQPLAEMDEAVNLTDHTRWPAFAHALVSTAIEEPLAERHIAATIATAIIEDATSNAVRIQYEESPYPRWVVLGEPVQESVPGHLNRLYQAYDPRSSPKCTDTLVAGCGSGRHALVVAQRDPSARVVAIDLSVASLSHATRKAREHGIENVEFRHMDILDVKQMDERFAVIESFGVLHHMREPAKGLAALRQVLLPGGAMKLALYSRKARHLVNEARATIDRLQLGARREDIRALRARIFGGEEASLEGLFDSSDFYASSACRDLLFHVQEHQYLAPDIETLLTQNDLNLLGFYFTNESIPERYLAQYPDDPDLRNMANWDSFESQFPATFSNCFQFWCQTPV
ncbi:MAG: methyltransferase domain-containing protein [Chromatiales bacterium]|jgi:Flp pilus assembly protein TadD/SAM-dependent methyltransferase|nr:methyltransferase domain-containing protein [Chromatiales bacterium]